MDDKLFTIQEVANRLGIHWQTVRNYIKNGNLPAVKFGRNVRVSSNKLDDFINRENMNIQSKTISFDKNIVCVADDYGFTESVNNGTVYCFKNKSILTEISFMVLSNASEHGALLLRKNKILDVGLHLCLLPWIGTKRPHKQDYIDLFSSNDTINIKKMFDDEMDLFIKMVGKLPTHICPQMGIHANLKLLQIIIDFAQKNNIYVRIPLTTLGESGADVANNNYAGITLLKRSGLRMSHYLFGHVTGSVSQNIMDSFIRDLKIVRTGETAELFFHPGFFDEQLLDLSGLNYERSRDISIICNNQFKNEIKSLGFTFKTLSQIK